MTYCIWYYNSALGALATMLYTNLRFNYLLANKHRLHELHTRHWDNNW